ncbi:HlyD family secretion protein [Paraburkholderia caballeronis]|uniref:HlyD family secretion protein n=1 Tax=Paraburkholderia caballeronis TaxID=416943 RepID=UPI0010660EA8|nr:HlyD family secretion protein [Paraburkholderia caballeronis]TDV21044.1 membrane fusion protein (multidrug efflux system) [Paraburkholderia caballeronis]TDV21473.1 membrane fusion protein (multidrug efflux system) [Paraburkholderia caballeronis]TDV33512.1 membrane fusion protein (multidrug efflux system) [Paraburkholderia caballeronis]TDV37863.1 membrane fusion protein (multidrug efflux system) [Paraburkholderia caballeronis]
MRERAATSVGAWARRHRGGPRHAAHHGGGNGEAKKTGDDGKQKGDSDPHGNDDRKPRGPGKKPLIVLAVVVVLIAIGALIWWLATRNQQSTDDAYTDGNAITIAPKVSGYVAKLAIDDNVYVHKGQLMVEIDRRDYEAQVEQARAQLGLALAQLDAAQAQLDIARVQFPAQYQQARAQIETATAQFARAQAEYQRQHSVDQRATSQQNVDTADAQQRSAHADVMNAQAQLKTASLVPQQIRAAVAAVEERRQQVSAAEAQLDAAQLNLGWCDVRAPSDGWVTRRNVQYGSFLQAGASLFSIVTPRVWITANFKESQLDRMRAGDKVKISVDAYPKLELHGHVDSVQLGSGSRFSAFPAENATGNFVKIVQRVPVKIVIDDGMPADHPLPLGLSVEPTVYLRH